MDSEKHHKLDGLRKSTAHIKWNWTVLKIAWAIKKVWNRTVPESVGNKKRKWTVPESLGIQKGLKLTVPACVQLSHKPFNIGNRFHYPWSVHFWGKDRPFNVGTFHFCSKESRLYLKWPSTYTRTVHFPDRHYQRNVHLRIVYSRHRSLSPRLSNWTHFYFTSNGSSQFSKLRLIWKPRMKYLLVSSWFLWPWVKSTVIIH